MAMTFPVLYSETFQEWLLLQTGPEALHGQPVFTRSITLVRTRECHPMATFVFPNY